MKDARLTSAVDDVAKDWKRAAYYDEAEHGIERQWKTLIWPRIKHCNFDVVVDLAAGHGRNSRKLLEHAKTLYIVDVNEENVSFCRSRFAGERNVTVFRNNGYTRSEEHTDDLQPLMRTSYDVFCLQTQQHHTITPIKKTH